MATEAREAWGENNNLTSFTAYINVVEAKIEVAEENYLRAQELLDEVEPLHRQLTEDFAGVQLYWLALAKAELLQTEIGLRTDNREYAETHLKKALAALEGTTRAYGQDLTNKSPSPSTIGYGPTWCLLDIRCG
ncbi:MAG: hypothetical protein R3B96_01640 [Pirellulaceae bacterium]